MIPFYLEITSWNKWTLVNKESITKTYTCKCICICGMIKLIGKETKIFLHAALQGRNVEEQFLRIMFWTICYLTYLFDGGPGMNVRGWPLKHSCSYISWTVNNRLTRVKQIMFIFKKPFICYQEKGGDPSNCRPGGLQSLSMINLSWAIISD